MATAKKNYAYQIAYEILAIILPLITAPYLTRVLGANNLGIYAYSMSVANLFLKIASLGIVNHGSRTIAEVQRQKDLRSKVFWSIYIIQFIAGVITIISYTVYVLCFVKENQLIAWIMLLTIVSALFDISWLYMGLEDFRKTFIRNSVVKFVSLISIFIFIRTREDLWKYALIMVLSVLLGQLTLWKGFKRIIDWSFPCKEDILKNLKPIFVLFVPAIAVMIYTIMDKIMLGNMSGNAEVGYYEYSSSLVSVPLAFITSFGAVMLPRMSAMVSQGYSRDEKNRMIQVSLLFVAFLGSSFAFGLAAISNELIPVYYGMEFIACIPIMILLSLKLPFMAWANVVRTQCLIPNHRDKEYVISLFLGAIVNLLLNLMFIPHFGALGAAIGTISAEIVVCVSQTIFSRKLMLFKMAVFKCCGFIIIGIIMFICVRLFAVSIGITGWIGVLMEIVLGAIVYLFLAMLYYSFILKHQKLLESIMELKNMIRKKQ